MRPKFFTLASVLSLLLCAATVVLSVWNDAHASEYGAGLRFSRGYFSLGYSQDRWGVGYIPPHGSYFYLRFALWPVIVMTAVPPLIWLSRAERKIGGITARRTL
jgi:hypothetical protein